MLDKLLDIFATWDRLGQAIFVLLILGMISAAFAVPFRYLAVIIRGWPMVESKRLVDESEDNDE